MYTWTSLAAWCCLVLLCGGCRREPAGLNAVPTTAVSPRENGGPGAAEQSAVSAAAAKLRFTHVAESAGVAFEYQNGREAGHDSILESLGGGVALVDFDLDGRLDLFFPGGGGYEGRQTRGLPAKLFRNEADWRFRDVSTAAGGGFPTSYYSHGSFVGDYDNDGFPDVLVTGYGGLQFWRNLGDGTFVESHVEAQLLDTLWSSAAGWGDVNGDGWLDLYVAHYVNWSFDNHPFCVGPRPDLREICSPRSFEPLPDALYLNAGDGTFRDFTEEAGLRPDGKGLGVALGDIDLDSDLDIYVANDTTDNFLYLNDGAGHFQEVGALSGVAVDERGTPNGSMGVDFGDYNLDGLPDIWVANFEVESFALYRNDGNNLFLHVSQATGITALNGLFVGFGTLFHDLDRDGDEDLIVTNGHVINFPRSAPVQQLPLVLLNNEGRRFVRLNLPDPYFSAPHRGRGLALGDLDNDGDVDFAFSNNHEPAALLRNDSTDDGGWVRVRLIGRRSNREAIGAVLILKTTEGPRLRMIKGGTSYLSHSDLRPIWGLPAGARVTGLEVHWPSGQVQTIEHIRTGDTTHLLEPGLSEEP